MLIVLPPQWGNHQTVNLPSTLPEHAYLSSLEPLGWIHTQPNETPQLAPQDIVTHAKIMAEHKSWLPDTTITITCSFTPGSCSLTGYRLSASGLEWGRVQKDALHQSAGYSPAHYVKVPILLSDRMVGSWMVPDTCEWNLNFAGAKHSVNMKYGVKLDNPKEFYHESHRPGHFLKVRALPTRGLGAEAPARADGPLRWLRTQLIDIVALSWVCCAVFSVCAVRGAGGGPRRRQRPRGSVQVNRSPSRRLLQLQPQSAPLLSAHARHCTRIVTTRTTLVHPTTISAIEQGQPPAARLFAAQPALFISFRFHSQVPIHTVERIFKTIATPAVN